jgi:hypothetical protein
MAEPAKKVKVNSGSDNTAGTLLHSHSPANQINLGAGNVDFVSVLVFRRAYSDSWFRRSCHSGCSCRYVLVKRIGLDFLWWEGEGEGADFVCGFGCCLISQVVMRWHIFLLYILKLGFCNCG